MGDIDAMLDTYVALISEKSSRIRSYAEDPTVELGEDNFEYFLRTHRVVITVFEAEWCSPCKVYKPIFLEVARRYRERGAVFAKVDTDKAPRVADAYNVEYIPTTLVYVEARPVDALVGAVEKTTLEKIVLKYLPSPQRTGSAASSADR